MHCTVSVSTWVRLPPECRPGGWSHIKGPVVPLVKALYGHLKTILFRGLGPFLTRKTESFAEKKFFKVFRTAASEKRVEMGRFPTKRVKF